MQAENNALQEVNILLLGEAGVVKSTFINAIANYMSYDTLEDAVKSEIKVVIPGPTTMTNGNFEGTGTVANEVHIAGQTSAQLPINHTFRTNGMVLRIIDTPGIGDTRGVNQAKESFQHIMNHLSNINRIHGICVLLRPNYPRISFSFEFYIKELLTHLYRNTCNNIAFCFTNPRNTFNRSDGTLSILKAVLTNGNPPPSLIPLDERTTYSLDNEAFHCLIAIKRGETFDEDKMNSASESWKTSSEETRRMIQYFQNITPHGSESTVTLNATHQTIFKLAKPLTEVSQQIQSNIALLDDKIQELQNINFRDEHDVRRKIKISLVELHTVIFDYPKTVCAALECTEKISMRRTNEGAQVFITDYKQVCHDNCTLKGVAANQIYCAELQGCWAMVMTNGTCRKCQHGWESHMHITHDIMRVNVDVVEDKVEFDVRSEEELTKAVESVISQCQARRKQYEYEQYVITSTVAKFAVFLKENSTPPYNNASRRFLDYFFELDENKMNIAMAKATLLHQLKDLMSSQNSNISLKEIQDSLKGLYNLSFTGATIQKLLETATGADNIDSRKCKLPIRINSESRNCWGW